jgi:hypothetical protein
LVRSEDLVLANVPKLSGAIPVRGFDADDKVIKSPFVNLLDIRWFQEGRGIFVYVHNGDMNRSTGGGKENN